MKGASEILTRKSTCYVIVHHDDVPGGTGVEMVPIGEFEEDTHNHILHFSNFVGTITLCYRDFRRLAHSHRGPEDRSSLHC